MTWVDYAILLIIGVSFLFGLWRGLVREVLSLLAWIAALLIARVYSEHLAPLFSDFISNETARYVLAFALLFIVTLMLGALINHFMARLISISGLKLTDRLLGGGFGVARGVLIGALGIFFATSFYATTYWWQESVLIPYGIEIIEWSKMFVTDYTAEP